jgi:hypothetical protein
MAHQEVDLDFLVAAVSLPVFMPPVQRGSAIYTDSVWIRDANLIEAVRRECRELWLVWCIGNTGRYRSGILPQYVHMIEMSANGTLFEDFERIREANARSGPSAEDAGPGPIRLHVIRPEFPLPLDPEFYEGRVTADTLIAMGYRDARAYLGRRRPEGIPLDSRATRMRDPGRTVMFRESWAGPFSLGAKDPEEGAQRGESAGTTMTLEVAVEIHDLDRFVREVDHTGPLCGYVTFDGSGGRLPVAGGTFNVFAPAPVGRPDDRVCAYDLSFGDDRRPYRLSGRRELRDDPGIDVWRDLSTMFVTLHDGTDPDDPAIGAGVLRADAGDLRRTITSVHVVGADSLAERIDTAADFGRFVLGRLWETYGPG